MKAKEIVMVQGMEVNMMVMQAAKETWFVGAIIVKSLVIIIMKRMIAVKDLNK